MAAGQMGRSSTFLTFSKAPVGAAMRLYAFAHAGGTASTYAQWSRLLTPEIEVVGIELPGHGTRLMEPPLSSVSEMVQEVVQALQRSVEGENPASPRPFAFYGHSLGAIVAFETARLLAPDPRFALSHLFVGAARAPHLPRPTQAITHLSEDEFLVAVQQRYGGIPSAVLDEPELLEMILPALRGDFVAYEDYRLEQGSPLPCPITAFTGDRDPIVKEEAVAEWSDHTTGSFRMHVVPGDHFFLAECRDQVLGILSRSLRGDPRVTQQETGRLSPATRAR